MEKNIHLVSTILGLGIVILGANVIIPTLSILVSETITNKESWGYWVESDTTFNVSSIDRILMFVNWFSYILIVTFACLKALQICQSYRAGRYFDQRTYTLIFQLGLSIICVVIGYYLAENIDTYLVTSTSNDISFFEYSYLYFDTEQFTILFCGIFFCVIGWVMKIASEIKDDNEKFV